RVRCVLFPATHTRLLPGGIPMPTPTRVLIADDNRIAREMMRSQLTAWGIDTTLARDGEEAWRILSQPNPPRIAILDWSMPGTDGLELCRRVRASEDERYTYLILHTAHE